MIHDMWDGRRRGGWYGIGGMGGEWMDNKGSCDGGVHVSSLQTLVRACDDDGAAADVKKVWMLVD